MWLHKGSKQKRLAVVMVRDKFNTEVSSAGHLKITKLKRMKTLSKKDHNIRR